MAEEETRLLIRKKLETDEEMRKMKSLALKVPNSALDVHYK